MVSYPRLRGRGAIGPIGLRLESHNIIAPHTIPPNHSTWLHGGWPPGFSGLVLAAVCHDHCHGHCHCHCSASTSPTATAAHYNIRHPNPGFIELLHTQRYALSFYHFQPPDPTAPFSSRRFPQSHLLSFASPAVCPPTLSMLFP